MFALLHSSGRSIVTGCYNKLVDIAFTGTVTLGFGAWKLSLCDSALDSDCSIHASAVR